MNKAIIVGRLGQKPELKYTPAQTGVTNITLATTESFKDASGNYTDKTEWHRVVVFGKTAEFVANYLDKGALILVEGRLQTRSWDDRDGQKKFTTEIVANVVTPFTYGKQQDQQNQSSNQSSKPEPPVNPFGGDDEEPLPF